MFFKIQGLQIDNVIDSSILISRKIPLTFLVPVIPQTGLPGGGGVIPGAGKKASKLPGLKK